MTHRHHPRYVELTPEEREEARAMQRRAIAPPGQALSRRGFILGSLSAIGCSLAARFDEMLGKARATASAPTATTSPIRIATPAGSVTALKQIFIAPDDHTDFFWTADEATYRDAFLEMIDHYLDLANATANEPSDFQSRWNCDGHFWLWEYEKNKTPAQFQALINRIQDGHISAPLNALCLCLGGAPAEAVLRGMYYPGQLERRYGLRFRLAYAVENQTLPYGLGALWAGAGARYSWKGICQCASLVDAADREHDIYWWTSFDGSRLLIKWNSLLVDNEHMGGYAEARHTGEIIDYVSSDAGFIQRYAHQVIGAFGAGWDDLKTLLGRPGHLPTFTSVAKSKTNTERRVAVSNEEDFFTEFLSQTNNGAALPSLACSFGNEWDLDSMALSEVHARVKRAVEKLRGAEAMATLVLLKRPAANLIDPAARDQAWMNLGLFWEHDLAGNHNDAPLTQGRIAWQKRLRNEIESYVNGLHTNAAQALGTLIAAGSTDPRFFVFNPLSWTRTDSADFAYSGPTPVHVVDVTTGQEVPAQIVTLNGAAHVRILASNVPAVGYKVFEIRLGAGSITSGGPTANASSGIVENELYRVTVAARGAITQLLDKTRSNRELVAASGALNDLGAGSGTLAVENVGVVSATLRATSSNPLTHVTRITLLRGLNRVDIRNEINQNFDETRVWTFNFNLSNPDVWHEEVGAVIRARRQPEGHYYNNANHPRQKQNARYDWLTLNHFAAMTGNGPFGVTLSNADCYFMQLGNSTVSNLDIATPQLKVLLGGRDLNANPCAITDQGGDNAFVRRFALRTYDAYDQPAAMRFALEHQNPLITGLVSGADAAYPADNFSLLTISNSNVILWALKPADDGITAGVIARVWNLAASASTYALSLTNNPLLSAVHTTHIETPEGDLPLAGGVLSDTLQPQQIKTYALKPASLTANLDKKAYLPIITEQFTHSRSAF
jgi:alpha-mannosidase